MIISKPNPKGIDVKILDIQSFVHDYLIKKWGIADEKSYVAYGRAYRNQVKEGYGYIPEVFKKGTEYSDPLLDDTKALTSFFGVGPKVTVKAGMSIAEVHQIFCINLKRIKPSDFRQDEEVHMDILSAYNHPDLNIPTTSTEQWMDAVFREYTGYRAQENMKFRDMHPYHCFRVNFQLNYYSNNC